MAALETLLAERLGLDATLVGPSFLPFAVRQAMGESGFSDMDGFVRAAATGGDAWDTLVERVVVSETWFFRDGLPFSILVDLARRRGASPASPLRILSCPCATGEEPYSAVMALLDAGMPREAFVVHAVDVSRRALVDAAAGTYRLRALRGLDPEVRETHFTADAVTGLWTVRPDIRDAVAFRPGNVVSGEGLTGTGLYDVVLCRNLLIYLGGAARVAALATVRRLLAPEGCLIVGHAEPAIAREHGFHAIGDPAAFAFVTTGAPTGEARRQGVGVPRVPAVSPRRNSVPDRLNGPRAGAGPAISTVTPAAVRAVAGDAGGPQDGALETVRALGDRGEIDAALQLCLEYLARVRDSADGHFLLGVLRDAQGDTAGAVQALRRAIYLDPAHEAALLHLASRLDAAGDTSGARRLRRRAATAHPPPETGTR